MKIGTLTGMLRSTITSITLGLVLSCHAETPAAARSAGNKLPVQLVGLTVTPHVRAGSLRYNKPPPPDLGARVDLFIQNTAPESAGTNGTVMFNAVLFDGGEPQRLIMDGDWAWHDTPNSWPEEELHLPPSTVSAWSFNTKASQWGLGRLATVSITDWQRLGKAELNLNLAPQGVWLSSITFASTDKNSLPDTLYFYIDNQAATPVRLVRSRLYLPKSNAQYRVLWPQPPFSQFQSWPVDGLIPAGDKGLVKVTTGRLPLTYAALQVTLADPQGRHFYLWGHLRIKRESFDISGGWVNSTIKGAQTLAYEPFLKTLKRMHINTAHLTEVPGYTDQTGLEGLYTRYPLKRFGKLDPSSRYETDALLPFVHGVEFLGEPQLGKNGVPESPQAVFQALHPWAKSRLATTVTLSDESTWRFYAGLSDYPHFDAYRVSAPAADDWRSYNRWPDKPMSWGAPLETIGDLCRSLREMSRPAPLAYWSQGPHGDWDVLDGRKRTSPTPDEIRMQAYHALSSRITSLYWFNLNLRALVRFRDTLDELTRIGREIRLLEDFYLEGDAYRYQQTTREGKPDWDLASIVSPRGAVLFALDLDYEPNPSAKVFEFKRKRDSKFFYDLPVWLRRPADVFRIDADGIYPVNYVLIGSGVEITDKQSRVAIYVATPQTGLRAQLEQKRLALAGEEEVLNFDPAGKGRDFDLLKAPLEQK